ncbi:MAG: hypothetical protein ACI9D5_000069 [Candidatus Endobugula sp.]|jgi:hypothetical protein
MGKWRMAYTSDAKPSNNKGFEPIKTGKNSCLHFFKGFFFCTLIDTVNFLTQKVAH